MAWEHVELTREDLYRLVWEQPVQKVAHRLDISDVALAKTCRRLGVPLPGRGYWAQKASTGKAHVPLLPKAKRGQDRPYLGRMWTDPNTDPPSRTPSDLEEIFVPDELRDPHPLITVSLAHLRQAKDVREDVLERESCASITAQTQMAMTRAIRIMDTLLKALEAKGWSVRITPPRPGNPDAYGRVAVAPSETIAQLGDTKITFGIYECSDQVATTPKRRGGIFNTYVPRPECKAVPNGRLSLRITSWHYGRSQSSWTDGSRQKVENCLGKFLAAVALLDQSERVRKAELAERERQREEEWRQAQEREQRRAAETARQQDLNERLESWKQSRQITALTDAVERTARSEGKDLGRWLAWARARAASLQDRALRFGPDESKS